MSVQARQQLCEGPNIVVICEYDALPEIGHACGHNLIAEVGVGAGIGILEALKCATNNGNYLGQVTVLGTPGEESGGGKVDMLDAGAFKGVDMAMMCHPGPGSIPHPTGSLSITRVSVKYMGQARHAALCPWEGVNALDAAVMAYNHISVMRQQMKPSWKIHGIIANGGEAPNVIPEHAEIIYFMRAPTFKELNVLKNKAMKCFEAAALATGCQVEVKALNKDYINLITNPMMTDLYVDNLRRLGDEFLPETLKRDLVASTDMGNVSHVVPSIHPVYHHGFDASNHTREFTATAGSEKAQLYTLTQAKCLAMVALDVYCDPTLLATIREQFKAQTET